MSSKSPDSGSALDPHFLRKLERLRIRARRAVQGSHRGERRSTKTGSSVEFADFRKYEPGDDYRRIDWSIYARLERLMLRQFVDEEDVRIDILVDRSKSMQFGSPNTKLVCACRAAAAIAFIAVRNLDRVAIWGFDNESTTRMRPVRGRGQFRRIVESLNLLAQDGLSGRMSEADPSGMRVDAADGAFLQGKPGSGVGLEGLSTVIKQYLASSMRSGIAFVISDFLDPGDFKRELRVLALRGFELNLLQVLAPDELNPEVAGDLLLVDSETGSVREVTANARVVSAYRAALRDYIDSLAAFSRSNGIGYLQLESGPDFEDMLLKGLIERRITE